MTAKTRYEGSSRARGSAAVLLGFLLAGPIDAVRADDLTWIVAPYLWASDVGVDLTVNNEPVLGTETAFRDLLDKLDMAFMGHVEVAGERFGGFFDVIYIDLSDSQTVPVGPGDPIQGDISADGNIEMQVFELGGFYRFPNQGGKTNFDILFGVRQVNADLKVDLTFPGPIGATPALAIDNSETDILAGARLVGRFNERWGYKARVDYAAGGSEGAINLLGAIGYTFGETGLFTLDFGYRYFNIEFEKSLGQTNLGEASAQTDITMSGPLIGFIFEF